MDNVYIENIQVETIIGVYKFEKTTSQPIIIDLEMTTDFSLAFFSDELKDTLDYDAISQLVRAFCEESQYALLEALAGGIMNLLFKNKSISKISIHIRKPLALTNGALASVRCERTREQMPITTIL